MSVGTYTPSSHVRYGKQQHQHQHQQQHQQQQQQQKMDDQIESLKVRCIQHRKLAPMTSCLDVFGRPG